MLGPSGCGKTTTLRMIAGFETPDAGRILLQGGDVTHVPPAKRHVNMVFQAYGLFPHMTVGENIAFGPQDQEAVRGPRRRERVAEIAARRAARGLRGPPPGPALGRPAAARRAGARAGQPARGAAAGRAARCARPEAAQGDAAGAEGPATAHRHHVRLRHARPGRGDDDERPHRRDERRGGRAARHAARALPAPASAFVAGFIGTSNLIDTAGGPSRRRTVGDGPRRGPAHPGGAARCRRRGRRPGHDHRAPGVDQARERRCRAARLPASAAP